VKFLDAQALGRQVFLTMHELFDRLAGRQPVAIVLEDWHWVDHSSVALCEHLLPLTRSHQLLVWFATRAEPAEPAARIRAAATAGGGTAAVEIALAPLAEDQSRALIDNLTGTRDLPDAVRGQILAKTGGEPVLRRGGAPRSHRRWYARPRCPGWPLAPRRPAHHGR